MSDLLLEWETKPSQNKAYGKMGFTERSLWFSFFHEVCHILRHNKKTVFYENGKGKDSADEAEADRFASDILIPPNVVSKLPYLRTPTAVIAFAKEINVLPGIVVGRLQHDKLIHPGYMIGLKKKLTWGKAE